MSAPLAGKFQDHYAILGVDPKSNSAAIQEAYTKAAQKYHPNNKDTGDQAKFDAVNAAYEVLADPALRKEFDKLKGVDQDDGIPRFSGLEFFESLGRETKMRIALLCILYDRRRTKPFTPSLSMRQVENSLQATEEELSFALWYLKQRGLAGQDDKSSLLITVEGMDFLENNPPVADAVMPFIKPAALARKKPEANKAEEAQPEPAAQIPTSPLATLANALGSSTAAPKPEAEHKQQESLQSVLRRARVKA